MGAVTEVLEWWPDYGSGPLWMRSGRGGVHVDAASLGLSSDLATRLAEWNASYSEDKLLRESDSDSAWISQGIELLAEVRQNLLGKFKIIVTEPWWGEHPHD
jgi:hypothetical protein